MASPLELEEVHTKRSVFVPAAVDASLVAVAAPLELAAVPPKTYAVVPADVHASRVAVAAALELEVVRLANYVVVPSDVAPASARQLWHWPTNAPDMPYQPNTTPGTPLSDLCTRYHMLHTVAT